MTRHNAALALPKDERPSNALPSLKDVEAVIPPTLPFYTGMAIEFGRIDETLRETREHIANYAATLDERTLASNALVIGECQEMIIRCARLLATIKERIGQHANRHARLS